jgi:hypothetical protein
MTATQTETEIATLAAEDFQPGERVAITIWGGAASNQTAVVFEIDDTDTYGPVHVKREYDGKLLGFQRDELTLVGA